MFFCPPYSYNLCNTVEGRVINAFVPSELSTSREMEIFPLNISLHFVVLCTLHMHCGNVRMCFALTAGWEERIVCVHFFALYTLCSQMCPPTAL